VKVAQTRFHAARLYFVNEAADEVASLNAPPVGWRRVLEPQVWRFGRGSASGAVCGCCSGRRLEQGEGAIINVASVNSFFHPDGLVVDYGAAKAALLNVAKAFDADPFGPSSCESQEAVQA
jgi:NAD(P)-dependent dehydrogenase (short-subunit alcohol dehydrogenase family)